MNLAIKTRIAVSIPLQICITFVTFNDGNISTDSILNTNKKKHPNNIQNYEL